MEDREGQVADATPMTDRTLHHILGGIMVVIVLITLPGAVLGWFVGFKVWAGIVGVVLVVGALWEHGLDGGEYGADTRDDVDPWWRDGEEE